MDAEKLAALRTAVNDYVEYVRSPGSNGDRAADHEGRVFEAAVELFHGEAVWDELNEVMRERW